MKWLILPLGLVLVAAWLMPTAPGEAGVPQTDGEIQRKPPPPKYEHVYYPTQGTVRAVEKFAVTIYFPGGTIMSSRGGTPFEASGFVPPETTRFQLSATLAAGGYPAPGRTPSTLLGGASVSESETYRVSDLQMGDLVRVHRYRRDGVDVLDAIMIERRPGGRIPPAPGQSPTVTVPYHELKDAYWDLEEKGIAYPAHFGYMRRFPPAPMPREVDRFPAPEPREVPLPVIPPAKD